MTRTDLALNFGGQISYVKFTLTYKDLQATSGAGAKTISLLENPGGAQLNPQNFMLPKAGIILAAILKCTTQFSGGNLNAMTCSIGYTGTAAGVMAAKDVLGATTYAIQRGMAAELTALDAIALTATFTPGVDPCSAATAGSVDLYFAMLNVSTP